VAERRKLRREIAQISTHFGSVEVKVGQLDGKVIQNAPEYESAKKIAAQTGQPVKQVYEAALRACKTEQ
jgi:hypothetical protein